VLPVDCATKVPKMGGFGADNPDFCADPEEFEEGETPAILCGPCPAGGDDWLVCLDLDGGLALRDVEQVLGPLPRDADVPPRQPRFLSGCPPGEAREALMQWTDVFGARQRGRQGQGPQGRRARSEVERRLRYRARRLGRPVRRRADRPAAGGRAGRARHPWAQEQRAERQQGGPAGRGRLVQRGRAGEQRHLGRRRRADRALPGEPAHGHSGRRRRGAVLGLLPAARAVPAGQPDHVRGAQGLLRAAHPGSMVGLGPLAQDRGLARGLAPGWLGPGRDAAPAGAGPAAEREGPNGPGLRCKARSRETRRAGREPVHRRRDAHP
jgi:hypothetical protein